MESVNAKVKIPPGLPFCKGRRNNAKGVEGKEGFSTIVGEEEIAAPDEAGLAMTGRRGSVQGSVLSVQGGEDRTAKTRQYRAGFPISRE
jgi:hypothetical protein